MFYYYVTSTKQKKLSLLIQENTNTQKIQGTNALEIPIACFYELTKITN